MATLPHLRALMKQALAIQDLPTRRAVRNIEDWADDLIRQLAALNISGGVTLPITEADVTNLVTDLASKVSTTRTISTTAPLAGGGDLSANRTLTVADNSTSSKGVVAQAPNDTLQFWRGDASWAAVPRGDSLFGSGYDGDLHFDGTTTILGIVPVANVYTLTRPIDARDLTIDGGVDIKPDGYPIHVSRTFSGSGRVHMNGADAVGRIGGTGYTAKTLPGSTAGGNGAIGVATASTAGGSVANSPFDFVDNQAIVGATGLTGGGGGGGSNGVSAGNGKGGAVARNAANMIDFRTIGWQTGRTSAGAVFSGATGGGGGNADTSSNDLGGGGGGGGGWIVLLVRNCTFTGSVEAKGGDGGAAVHVLGNCGGGGGGGGGVVVMVIGEGTLPTITVTGGIKGTSIGGGGAAGDGGPGINYSWKLV